MPVTFPPMLSLSVSRFTFSRACVMRARILQSFCFFAVTSVTQLSSITNVTGRKQRIRGKNTANLLSHREIQKTLKATFCQISSPHTHNQLNISTLHKYVTDVTAKTIKLLVIRACAREKRRGTNRQFHESQHSYCNKQCTRTFV